MGELIGVAIGTFLVGGLFGWLVHKVTGQPFAVADAIGLLGVVVIGLLSHASDGPSWLLYALVSFPAYFLLQRVRGSERMAASVRTEPTLPATDDPSPVSDSELAAQIAFEEEIAQSVRDHFRPASEPSHAQAPRPTKAPSRNFFIRHWRGELSLAVSYWVVNFCALIASIVAVAFINATLVPSRGYEPSLLLGVNILTWLVLSVILVWQVVGLWRCARKRAVELGKQRRSAFWPLAAQFAVVLGVLQFTAGFSASGVPTIAELSRIVFQNDPDIPLAVVTIADGGKTLKVEGGIKYGLTRNVETVLNAAPTVTALQLDSLGGRVAEATKLFDLVRSRQLDTFVSGECSSACTLVFAAGRDRFLGASAFLGFHSSAWPGATAVDIQEMNAAWAATYRSVGISSAFLARAMATPSSEMWYPTHAELIEAGVLAGDLATARHVPEGFTAAGSIEAMRQSFLALGTLYEAIDAFAPDAASRIYEAGSEYERGLITAESMRAIISQQIAIAVKSRVPNTDDETLVDYAALAAEQYAYLLQTNPDVCFRYAAGDPSLNISGHLSPELLQREKEFSERIIRSPVSPRAPGNLDATWDLISSMMLATVTEQQMEIFALPVENVHPSDYPSYCASAWAMMDAISRLPPHQAGPIVRFIYE